MIGKGLFKLLWVSGIDQTVFRCRQIELNIPGKLLPLQEKASKS